MKDLTQLVDWEKEERKRSLLLINAILSYKNPIFRSVAKVIFKSLTKNSSISVDPKDPSSSHLQIISVGNSHLDSAWKWRKSDSREKKIHHTFGRNVFYIESNKYPRYTFTANAAVHYDWIKEDYPAMFTEIKKLIQDGRWELVGGEWIEMDCNIPDGESLIRQRLIGQRYNLNEFGKLAVIGWMDDVFGWPCTFPQILRKTGCTQFFTNKLCYSTFSVQFNEDSPDYAGKEKFPFLHFNWQSPDGSKVMVTWAQHKLNFFTHLKHFTKHSRLVRDDVENSFNYQNSWQEMDTKCTDEVIPLLINAYGQGDGGMGPKPIEVNLLSAWDKMNLVELAPSSRMFELLEPYKDRLPIWRDELYLERHRGTLTSVAMIKENNHTAEVQFHNTELLLTLSTVIKNELKFYYDVGLDAKWKTLLFLQFHDVLPGSSIPEVYRDAAEDYNCILPQLYRLQKECIKDLCLSITSNTGESKQDIDYITVLNPCSFKRSFTLIIPKSLISDSVLSKIPSELYQEIAWNHSVQNRDLFNGFSNVNGTDYLKDSSGLSQLNDWIHTSKDLILLPLLHLQTLDSFELRTISFDSLIENLKENTKNEEKKNIQIGFSDFITHIEFTNLKITVQISKESGRIIHISDVDDKRNIIQELEHQFNPHAGIGYNLYKDNCNKADSWDIDPNYASKPVEFSQVKEITIEEQGPIRFTLLIEYEPTEFGSKFYTRYSFYNDSSQIFGETLVDWQEERKLLKLTIPTTFDTKKVICGSPYGHITRSTVPETVYQKAQYEFAFQQFAYLQNNLSNIERPNTIKALAMYSQTKYGMSADAGTISMTLLKSPYHPDPVMKYATMDPDSATRVKRNDMGFHRIPWAIEIFNQRDALMTAIKHGYEYNQPIITDTSKHSITPVSFFSVNNENVLINSIKVAEPPLSSKEDWFYHAATDEIPLILRVVEYLGLHTTCCLKTSNLFKIQRVIETDMLERIKDHDLSPQPINISGGNVNFQIAPHEIKTLLCVVSRRY